MSEPDWGQPIRGRLEIISLWLGRIFERCWSFSELYNTYYLIVRIWSIEHSARGTIRIRSSVNSTYTRARTLRLSRDLMLLFNLYPFLNSNTGVLIKLFFLSSCMMVCGPNHNEHQRQFWLRGRLKNTFHPSIDKTLLIIRSPSSLARCGEALAVTVCE